MGADTRIGTEVAGYRIESVIGRGGMGVVYLAEHLRLKRKVALKVLAPELAADDRFRERFVKESELAASLEHPNIVPIYDAGEAQGLLYIAMRFIEGTDVKTLIEREAPLESERTTSIISQVASALDVAHAKSLIHRDVKPANVLLDRTDHAYLTDFGLTKRPDQTTGLTKTGQFMGSVDYASPEQFEGKALDARTDVYSLACVAYECLTGTVPYPRDQEAAVMYAHLRDAPPRVSVVRPEIPAGVDVAIARGMAKKPEDRYRSAGGFGQALRAGLPEAVPSTRPVRSRRPPLLVGGAVFLVALLVAGVLILNRGSGTAPRDTSATGRGTVTPNVAGTAFVGVMRLDPATEKQVEIPIPLAVSDVPNDKSIVTGEGFVWLYDSQANTLFKISPQTNTVINTLTVTSGVGVAFGDGSLWVPPASFFVGPTGGSMARIDPSTVSISDDLRMPQGCCVGVAYGAGSVWGVGSSKILRVDPKTERIKDVIDSGGTNLSIAGGRVWILDGVIGRLLPVDAATDEVGEAIPLPGDPLALVATGDAVWVANKDGSVDKHPLTGNSGIDTKRVGARPNDIVVGEGSVWVACYGDGTVWKIDPLSGETERIEIGGHPTRIVVDRNGVWVVMEKESPRGFG